MTGIIGDCGSSYWLVLTEKMRTDFIAAVLDLDFNNDGGSISKELHFRSSTSEGLS